MLKLAIFDFDGTIADTFEPTIKFYNKIALKYNLKKITASEIETFRNLGARELVKSFRIPPWKLLILIKEIRSKLKEDIQNIPIIEGIPELFQELEKKKIKVGIVTSNSKENVQLLLKK